MEVAADLKLCQSTYLGKRRCLSFFWIALHRGMCSDRPARARIPQKDWSMEEGPTLFPPATGCFSRDQSC